MIAANAANPKSQAANRECLSLKHQAYSMIWTSHYIIIVHYIIVYNILYIVAHVSLCIITLNLYDTTWLHIILRYTTLHLFFIWNVLHYFTLYYIMFFYTIWSLYQMSIYINICILGCQIHLPWNYPRFDLGWGGLQCCFHHDRGKNFPVTHQKLNILLMVQKSSDHHLGCTKLM